MRTSFANVLIVTTITLALLVTSELGLRLAQPAKVAEYEDERARLRDLAYAHHPDYGVALEPNITRTFARTPANGGEAVTWSTNRAGYRGGPLRPDPELRVIVYGDSNVQARFSRPEDTFTARLEALLAERTGRDVEVINAGVVGFGPDQSLLRFRAEAAELTPDIVIFHVFADNDFGDLIRNRLFEIDADGRLVRHPDRPSLDQRIGASVPRWLLMRAALDLKNLMSGREPLPDRIASGLKAEEQLYLMLAIARMENAIYRDRQPRQVSHFADHYDVDLALEPDAPSSRAKVRLMELVLAEAKRVADHDDTDLLLLIQPSSRDLTENLKLNFRLFQQYPEYRQDRLTALLDDLGARHRIHRVNFFPIFAANDPSTLYFTDHDDHWNDAGQALAARATADYIHQHLLPPPAPAELVGRQAVIRRRTP